MAEPYSLRWFLLHAKQDMLNEFFHRQNLVLDHSSAQSGADEADRVLSSICALSSEHRDATEVCFRDIYRIATRSGCDAIIAASRSTQLRIPADDNLVQRLGRMESNLDRAFWIFLHRPQYWELACDLADADSISAAAWEKHPHVRRVAPNIDAATLRTFARALGNYFHAMEGRGDRCDVRACDRGDRYYVFCFLEQPSRADPEWQSEGLRRRTYKPAQQLIFMYSQTTGELDTYLRAKPRTVWDVTALFALHILGVRKLDPPSKGHGVYELGGFKRRGTIYSYGAESGILTVAVRKLRLTPKFGRKRHIVLEANPIGLDEPVYDVLEEDFRNVSLDDLDVTQVELKVVFDKTRLHRRRTISASITWPNRCSLGYDDLDLTVRKMLVASSIELKASKAPGDRT